MYIRYINFASVSLKSVPFGFLNRGRVGRRSPEAHWTYKNPTFTVCVQRRYILKDLLSKQYIPYKYIDIIPLPAQTFISD